MRRAGRVIVYSDTLEATVAGILWAAAPGVQPYRVHCYRTKIDAA